MSTVELIWVTLVAATPLLLVVIAELGFPLLDGWQARRQARKVDP